MSGDADAPDRAPRRPSQSSASLRPLALPGATLLVALALLAATLLLSLRDPGADARNGRSAAAQIKPLAQKNKSVVRARVYDVGVIRASDRSVTVLAFVNQAKTSSDLERPAIDQNRVIAMLTRVDGRWLISGLKAF